MKANQDKRNKEYSRKSKFLKLLPKGDQRKRDKIKKDQKRMRSWNTKGKKARDMKLRNNHNQRNRKFNKKRKNRSNLPREKQDNKPWN